MMISIKICLLFLLYVHRINGQEARILSPKPEEQSFFSKLTDWIFPFRSNDNSLQTHQNNQYLPPLIQSQHQVDTGCNPCDVQPWIPIAQNLGPETVINFAPQYGPPKPDKINYVPPGPAIDQLPDYMVPPPIDIRPIKPIKLHYDVPIDMRPPPLPPTDSYGSPISPYNSENYNPPLLQIEPFPLSSNQLNIDLKPIPLPNAHFNQLLPIHHPQNFRDASKNVEVLPSVKVADYLSSIEHPINVIQSPLVEVTVNEKPERIIPKLSENPIVVEDTHASASVLNETRKEKPEKRGNDNNLDIVNFNKSETRSSSDAFELDSDIINQLISQTEFEVAVNTKNVSFTPSPLDYSRWKPTPDISTSMVPPPVGASTWVNPTSNLENTTKRNKQIQIVIPYISNKTKKPTNFSTLSSKKVPVKTSYSTLSPVYTPPPLATEESIWTKFIDNYNLAEANKGTASGFKVQTTTPVLNIQDFLKNELLPKPEPSNLPFDIITLQKNIDHWTQEEYSRRYGFNSRPNTNNILSKKIPDEYFTTQTYDTTTTNNFDHEPAGSNKDTKIADIENNLILSGTTTEYYSTTIETTTDKGTDEKSKKSLWDIAQVTVSPETKEKVYIVTPQPHKKSWSLPPKVLNSKNDDSLAKYLIRIDSNNSKSVKLQEGKPTVVFSEWPHLINNLQTTTSKPTSRHPLFGLMDLTAYTPPPNSTIETISGHSRVVTVVTPIPIKKKLYENSTNNVQ